MPTETRPAPATGPITRATTAAAAWPTLFISHGPPSIALEPGADVAAWQRAVSAAQATHGAPAVVLGLSAHSLAREPVVFGAAQHAAVHDFGGFDPALHDLRYDAPGSPQWAAEAAQALQDAGLPAHLDAQASGLDHGLWTVLRHLWPEAQLPVVPIAFPPNASPQALFALGQALRPLRARGALVLASGSLTHNLGRVRWDADTDDAHAQSAESRAFADWWAQRSAARDGEALMHWHAQAPHARLMHPTPEHLLPIFVAAGAAAEPSDGSWPRSTRLHAGHRMADLAMDAYAFG